MLLALGRPFLVADMVAASDLNWALGFGLFWYSVIFFGLFRFTVPEDDVA
jgi:hypothetical protein